MTTERERAQFYQDHKDDPEVWDDWEDRPSDAPRRGLSVTITVRFSPETSMGQRPTNTNENRLF